jgi:hypothetical protein
MCNAGLASDRDSSLRSPTYQFRAVVLLAFVAISVAFAGGLAAQSHTPPYILQVTPLDQIAPDLLEAIRLPGDPEEEAAPQKVDLPPPLKPVDDDLLKRREIRLGPQMSPLTPDLQSILERKRQRYQGAVRRFEDGVNDPLEPAVEEALSERGKVFRRPQRPLVGRERALYHHYLKRLLPDGEVPEDAHLRAWEHIQRMRPADEAEPQPTPTAEPISCSPQEQSWLARLLFPDNADAQCPPDTPTPTPTRNLIISNVKWEPAGPASFTITDAGGPHTGLVDGVAVAPQASGPKKIYVGTFGGGVWESLDQGQNWRTTTDILKSLRLREVLVHPNNANLVLVATGWAGAPGGGGLEAGGGVGVYRSSDAGATWCQIGPAWPIGTSHVNSTLTVGRLAIDTSKTPAEPVRVWAPTNRGLWWSDNAANPSTTCGAVTWTYVSDLESTGGTPFYVFQTFISPWNNQGFNTIYATVAEGDYANSNKGWWKSTDRGDTWTKINNGLPSANVLGVDRASIALNVPQEGYPPGTDIIYAMTYGGQVTCGVPITKVLLYRTVNSGGLWQRVPNIGDCDPFSRSVQVDPKNSNRIAAGGVGLYRSLDGGATWDDISSPLHVDHNALLFDPDDTNVFYSGNDGGLWRTNNFAQQPKPVWTNLNGNLHTAEFYRAVIDNLNYGITYGGTQDNGSIKGATQLPWYGSLGGGDSFNAPMIDPSDSNNVYMLDGQVYRWNNAGFHADRFEVANGLPTYPVGDTLTIDPSSPSTLLVYLENQKVYRTTNQGSSWASITSATIPGVEKLAVLPAPSAPSDRILAGTCGSVWRTLNASDWSEISSLEGCVSSFAVHESEACRNDVSQCTIYATARFNGNVYYSSDGGLSWTEISGSGGACTVNPSSCLPDGIPATKIVISPGDPDPAHPNTVYVSMAQGVYLGASDTVGNWEWFTFTSGMPPVAEVNDLAVHKGSGIMRAFTYGRGAWERRLGLGAIPNPDVQVNTGNYNTLTPDVTSARAGDYFWVTWLDDRDGANDWHVYARAFSDGAGGVPDPLAADFRVDTARPEIPHIAGPPRVAHAWSTDAVVTWHDDRFTPPANKIFFNCVSWDGYRMFGTDRRVDSHTSGFNATYPAVAMDNNQEFAITWQVEQTAGSGAEAPQDVYVRHFDIVGSAKGAQRKVNAAGTDARRPAIASRLWNSYFVAWQQRIDASNDAIMVRKYDVFGSPVGAALRLDDGTPSRHRSHVAVTADSIGQVIVSWNEENALDPGLPEWVASKRCDNFLGNCQFLDGQCPRCVGGDIVANEAVCPAEGCIGGSCVNKLACPPKYPFGGQRAWRSAVTTDQNRSIAIGWQGNINSPGSGSVPPNWDPFGRLFDASGALLRKDFRVDVADRADAVEPRVTNSSQSGRFIYVWRDNRLGGYNVYARVVP